MRVTRYTDYSMRVLMFLGLRSQRRSTIREISDAYGISRNHLMKVVQQLVALGYVHSVRGVGGGLTLARAPEEIRIGNVVRDMEPDLALVECMRPDNQCVITPGCKLKRMLAKAREGFLAVLNEYTLADTLTEAEARELALLLKIESPEHFSRQAVG
jgi:Rrf2 family transcriptional regulator, nitric oxide-sensitive transcriptional repressor